MLRQIVPILPFFSGCWQDPIYMDRVGSVAHLHVPPRHITLPVQRALQADSIVNRFMSRRKVNQLRIQAICRIGFNGLEEFFP